MRSLPQRLSERWRAATPRMRRWTAAALATLLGWAVAVAIANRPAAKARLRAEIRAALAKRLPGAELGDRLSVDPFFRVHFGALTLRAERKGAAPVLAADNVRVRASPWALLAGRLEPASVRLYGVRVVPGERLGELRALVDRMRPRTEPRPAAREPARSPPRDWPAIHLRSATVVLREGDEEHEVGPLDASVIRRRGPWRSIEEVEYATLEWVDWFNNRRLLEPIGDIPPAEFEAAYYRQQEAPALAA